MGGILNKGILRKFPPPWDFRSNPKVEAFLSVNGAVFGKWPYNGALPFHTPGLYVKPQCVGISLCKWGILNRGSGGHSSTLGL
jgi:hypothetical protein